MRKSHLAVPLLLLSMSCSTFTWKGHSPANETPGVRDIGELSSSYETETLWKSVRARRDGRVNALGRDLEHIQDLIDRHIFNYSPNDPYVNYPTDKTVLDPFTEFGVGLIAR